MKKQHADSTALELQLGGSAGDVSGDEPLFPKSLRPPKTGSAPEFDQEFLDFMITLMFYLSGRQGYLVLGFEEGIEEWGMFLYNFRSEARRLSPKTRKWLDRLIGDFQTLKPGHPESLKLRSHAVRLGELPHTILMGDGYRTLARPGFPEEVHNVLAKHPILQQVAREELRGVPGLVFLI